LLSKTHNKTNENIELFYGKGYVTGNVTYEYVSLMSIEVKSVKMKMLSVMEAKDLDGTQADGILGLSPSPHSGADSFVIEMQKEGVIDSAQFTVYIGNLNQASYIDFGSYKGNLSNVTWVDLTDAYYWRVYLNEITYKNKPLLIQTQKAVLDTGTSILGFPREDLKNIILSIKEDRQLFYLQDIGFYAVRCKNEDEFYDLIIDIKGHKTTISPKEYMLKVESYCIFFLFDLGNINFILLGDTYLKGNFYLRKLKFRKLDNPRYG
jgi:hypothetical protein